MIGANIESNWVSPGNNTDNGYWYTYSTEEGCKDRLIPNKAAYIVTKHGKNFILFKQLHWKYFNYFENRPTSKIKPLIKILDKTFLIDSLFLIVAGKKSLLSKIVYI